MRWSFDGSGRIVCRQSPPPPGIQAASAGGGEVGVAAPSRTELTGPHQAVHDSLRTTVGPPPYRPTPESIASGFDVGVTFVVVLSCLLGACSRVYVDQDAPESHRTGDARRLSKP